jgi:hypothetical protein
MTELVRLQSGGHNAVDIVLAYQMGRAAAVYPRARFHIISKDTGFDALLQYMRSKGICASRHANYAALKAELSGGPAYTPVPGELKDVIACLQKTPSSLPKKKKALTSYLRSSLGKDLSTDEIENLIESLLEHGHLEIDSKGVITYRLASNGHIERFPLESSNGTDDDIDIPEDGDIPF